VVQEDADEEKVIMVVHQKSDKPSLEESKTTGFLLGLILVLSLLFVGFEYNSQPQEDTSSEDMLDELAQDIELHPAIDEKEMVSTASHPTTKVVTDRIKAVDAPLKQQIDRLLPNTASPLLIGDGSAEALNAKISEALPPIPLVNNQTQNIRIVEQMPEFPGGGSAFVQWLTNQLRYPPVAQSKKVQGKVVVSFIVNKDGSIADIKLEKSVDPYLDREALRVIRMMPNWTPGVQNNRPCRTMVAVPVVFKL
jgi:hypothetical protein